MEFDIVAPLTELATSAKDQANSAAPIILSVIAVLLLINLGFKLFKRYGSKIG